MTTYRITASDLGDSQFAMLPCAGTSQHLGGTAQGRSLVRNPKRP